VRVTDCAGLVTTSGLIAGVEWVTANRVRPAVANMSLSSIASSALNLAVTNSINAGVTYVVSAGNANADACNYSPANLPATIAVGAIGGLDARGNYSNFGPCVDIFAPGTQIYSASNADDSAYFLDTGTSQASAFKVVYAGLTKGLQGLFVELLMGAKRFGLLDEIIKRYDESFPGLLEKVSSSIVGLRIHAGRRAEEMDELQRTYAHYGMQALMAPAIQKILGSIADLDIRESSEKGAREGDLMKTLELFYQEGLLSDARLASSAGK